MQSTEGGLGLELVTLGGLKRQQNWFLWIISANGSVIALNSLFDHSSNYNSWVQYQFVLFHFVCDDFCKCLQHFHCGLLGCRRSERPRPFVYLQGGVAAGIY